MRVQRRREERAKGGGGSGGVVQFLEFSRVRTRGKRRGPISASKSLFTLCRSASWARPGSRMSLLGRPASVCYHHCLNSSAQMEKQSMKAVEPGHPAAPVCVCTTKKKMHCYPKQTEAYRALRGNSSQRSEHGTLQWSNIWQIFATAVSHSGKSWPRFDLIACPRLYRACGAWARGELVAAISAFLGRTKILLMLPSAGMGLRGTFLSKPQTARRCTSA